MEFDFSEEQELLREQVRRLLQDQCPVVTAKRLLNETEKFPRAVWHNMAALGYMGVAIPQRYGGAGVGYPELCVIAEELGRVLAPLPFLSSIYLAPELLMLAGDEYQKQTYLPKISNGEMIMCVAPLNARSRGQHPVHYSGGTLYGNMPLILDGDIADRAIIAVPDATDCPEGSTSLILVDLSDPNVSRRAIPTLDNSRRHAEITFHGVAGDVLGRAGAGLDVFQRAKTRAAILLAFEQLGGAERCLEMAREHVIQRYAFGRPIGSFQAIKHKLVDMYVHNVIARAHAYYGAWSLSSVAPDLARAAACAHISATAAFSFAAQEAIQVHGGIGFTYEHDCNLFYRRSRVLASILGNILEWKEALAVIVTGVADCGELPRSAQAKSGDAPHPVSLGS